MEVGRNEFKRQRELQVTGQDAREASGWDPYEVWRTRVLLPRLRAEQALPEDAPRPVTIAISDAA